jgi:hypothetical protein
MIKDWKEDLKKMRGLGVEPRKALSHRIYQGCFRHRALGALIALKENANQKR